MQSKSRPMEDISNLLTNAAGALKGVGDEVKAMGRSQAEKLVADLDLVSREEFDVLKARLDKALAEIESLKGKTAPTKKTAPKPSTSQKPAAKKATARKPLKKGPTKKA
ncbi:accessory factor UbiK family protein [Litorimonas sp. RW-G-Af-16]|uniref:accessory factor UbiK family protein n=1 Tax=Litorimonas sp. RW-G-Af-16 TaxID=3241168 RepID=UPI00390C7DB5